MTPEGRVVWEFNNPHRAGEHKELVAVLFEMVRLPPDFLQKEGWGQAPTLGERPQPARSSPGLGLRGGRRSLRSLIP